MKRCKLSRALAVILCLMMVFSALPMEAFASSAKFTQAQLSIATDRTSTLATGVTQDLYTVYDKNGEQVKIFTATMDMNVSTVKLFTSYKDMDGSNYGMAKLTEQVASFNEKAANGDPYYQGTVVAGINATYYNMNNGAPSGAFFMNGVNYTASPNDGWGYFAVMKDGSVKIAKNSDYNNDKDNIQEAIGIYSGLVYDGKIVDNLDTQKKYPRQTIGITADNKVIVLTADGNQAPTSVGLTMQEQAQVMADLGCVYAGHLDGGGSATYGSRAEGSDTFALVNTPSDGSERSISAGLIIVSTEESSKSFDHVSMVANDEYLTVGSSTSIDIKGVSSSGASADIPSDITYEVQNGKYSDGELTATNLGDVVLTAKLGDSVVGSITLHCVVPDKIKFSTETITIPYGSTASLEIIATYGLNEVVTNSSNFTFDLDNPLAGTFDGLNITAATDVSITGTVITASFNGSDLKTSANLVFGKGSDVIFDFEDGTTNGFETGYEKYNYYLPNGGTFVATSENGKVHSGEYSLGVNIDYSNSQESGYQMTALYRDNPSGNNGITYYPSAQRIGCWVYIPDEYVGLWVRWVVFPIASINEDGTYSIKKESVTSNTLDDGAGGTGVVYSFQESGWHYLSCDLSAYKGLAWMDAYYCLQFYISDRDGTAYNYYAKNAHNINGDFTIYIDDITVDYSAVVDDREAPIFSNVTYATNAMSDASVLQNDENIDLNTVNFAASVAENTTKPNASGLDISTAKAYVDGNEVECTYNNGLIKIDNSVSLSKGKHTVKFSICDKQGNYASIIRNYNIVNGKDALVKVEPHDKTLDRILFGSLYYIDITTPSAENVQTVSVTLNLDSMNKWELDHMVVSEGYDVTYTYEQPDKILHLSITKCASNDSIGEQTILSIPVRIWELNNVGSKIGGGGTVKEGQYTYASFKNSGEYWKVALEVRIQQGLVNDTEYFTGDNVYCDTESWAIQKFMIETKEGQEYKNAWNGGHIHTPESLPDKVALCEERGYTGRTYCEVCKSVVDWGTDIPATGHSYENVSGIMKCTSCDTLCNGEYNGKSYKDGVSLNGWVGNSYYTDGVKATGIQKVKEPDGEEEYYYNFGDNGLCEDRTKYIGLVKIGDQWYYSKFGKLVSGWQQIDDAWHYFNPKTNAAVSGEYSVNGVTYQFDETGKTNGTWQVTDKGKRYWYGAWYYVAGNDSQCKFVTIDGKVYNFDTHGYVTTGIQVLYDDYGSSIRGEKTVWEFDDNGVLVGKITSSGLIKNQIGDMYIIESDGYVHTTNPQLINYNGEIYFICYSGKLKQNGPQIINSSNNNGLLENGTYYFGADGKLSDYTGVEFGMDDTLYYYKDGKVTTGLYNGELVSVDGDIYFVKWSGKVAVNETRNVTASNSNGLMPAGSYTFGEDGKLVKFTGVKAGTDGNLYYYKDGEITTGLYNGELVSVDGNIYFVKWSGKVAVNETRNVTASNSNGLMPNGSYYFGKDGKLVKFTGVKAGTDGNLYYYEDGKIAMGSHNGELVSVDGNIYFVKWSGKVAVNETRNVTASNSNGLMPAGSYTFGEDGIMTMS